MACEDCLKKRCHAAPEDLKIGLRSLMVCRNLIDVSLGSTAPRRLCVPTYHDAARVAESGHIPTSTGEGRLPILPARVSGAVGRGLGRSANRCTYMRFPRHASS
jgi:hypothetical protein